MIISWLSNADGGLLVESLAPCERFAIEAGDSLFYAAPRNGHHGAVAAYAINTSIHRDRSVLVVAADQHTATDWYLPLRDTYGDQKRVRLLDTECLPALPPSILVADLESLLVAWKEDQQLLEAFDLVVFDQLLLMSARPERTD